jgi:hypothetical protein
MPFKPVFPNLSGAYDALQSLANLQPPPQNYRNLRITWAQLQAINLEYLQIKNILL